MVRRGCCPPLAESDVMMKCRAALVALLLLVPAGRAAAQEADAAVINTFETLCTHQPLSFDGVDRMAAAMKLADHRHMGEGAASGPFSHSKSWIFSLGATPHELVVAEANSPKGHVTTCGVSAEYSSGGAFRASLMAALRLGAPTGETVSPDGTMRTTLWRGVFGEATTLRMIDQTPKSQPGVMLFYDLAASPLP